MGGLIYIQIENGQNECSPPIFEHMCCVPWFNFN